MNFDFNWKISKKQEEEKFLSSSLKEVTEIPSTDYHIQTKNIFNDFFEN